MANLDHLSETQILPAVLQAITSQCQAVGNAASLHAAGRRARMVVDGCAETLLGHTGANARVVFTSGAQEATILALLGLAQAARGKAASRTTVLLSPLLGAGLWEASRALEQQGFALRWLPVANGRIQAAEARALMDKSLALLALQQVHGESGVVQNDAAELITAAHACGALVHLDATVGFKHLSYEGPSPDSMAVDGHAIGGPRAVGALLVGKHLHLQPLWQGGGQEWGMRPGSQAVPLIDGFNAALTHLQWMRQRLDELAPLRDKLQAAAKDFGQGQIVGQAERRVGTTFGLCLPHAVGRALHTRLSNEGVRVGLGDRRLEKVVSAAPEPMSVLRFALGWSTTEADINAALPVLK